MAFSFTQATGDGSTTAFTFSFTGPDNGYYSEDQIKVYVDDVEVTYTLTGTNQVTLDSAPAEGASVWIKREPDITNTYTNFSRGNNFGKDNINRAFQQMLYLIQRVQDGFKEEGYYQKQDMSLGNFKITDLGDGEADQDACTIGQLNDRVASNDANLTAAQAAQAAAELAQSLSEVAQAASEAAQVAAEAARDLSLTYSNNSSNSADASEASATLAERWANEAEDVEVTTGNYSAFHWSEKAKVFSDGSAINIRTTPYGDLESTNVQSALNELDDEKLPLTGGTISGDLVISGDFYSNKTAVMTPESGVKFAMIVRGDATLNSPTLRFSAYDFTSYGNLGANASGDLYWGSNLLWHKGNDGAGSGLDADLLDARNSTAFAFSETTSKTDMNKVVQSGMYRFDTPSNVPTAARYGNVLVAHGGGDTIFQIAADFQSNHIYWRSGNSSDVGGSGAWCPWRELWHSGSMDPGVNGIGSIKLARYIGGTISSGTTVDGSAIYEGKLSTSIGWTDNGVLTGTGTWRSMQSLSTTHPIGLFQRIA